MYQVVRWLRLVDLSFRESGDDNHLWLCRNKLYIHGDISESYLSTFATMSTVNDEQKSYQNSSLRC